MNRKLKISIGLFSVFLIAIASIGTVAYFSKNFTSDNNVATAASFEVDVVDVDGQPIGDGEFSVNDGLHPGVEDKQVYAFQINKGKTDVPVEYSVNLNASGALFPEDNTSPVILDLQRNIDDNWTNVDNDAFSPESDTEEYRILLSWPHGENDIDFQGATGNIRLDVVATQVEANTAEEATAILGEIEDALRELDKFSGGNFSKAQADAVQDLLNDALEYINAVTSGQKELLNEVDSIQSALDKKIESRYVLYNLVDGETDSTQLKFKTSAKLNKQSIRDDWPAKLKFSEQFQLKGNFWIMEYVDPKQAKVGQVFNLELRFHDNVKNIDATFTNLGDGNWGIESDWLVEKE